MNTSSQEIINRQTPEELAECFPVSRELNLHLWNDIIPQVKIEHYPEEGYSVCPPWAHLIDAKFHGEFNTLLLHELINPLY